MLGGMLKSMVGGDKIVEIVEDQLLSLCVKQAARIGVPKENVTIMFMTDANGRVTLHCYLTDMGVMSYHSELTKEDIKKMLM